MADDAAPREQAHELLAAYALDAVDDLERRAVERLLAGDPDARRELDEYREVVAAFTVPEQPPTALREQVLARVAALAAAPSAAPSAEQEITAHGTEATDTARRDDAARPSAPARTSHRPVAHPLRRRLAALGVAAAIVTAVAIPTTIAIQATQSQRELQAEADTIAQMLADPDAQMLTADMSGGGEVSALVSAGHVLLAASGMADPGEGQDYQLWEINGDSITSAGLIRPTDGSASALLEAAPGTTLAVTLEPTGGSEQPTTEPLVAVQT